MTVGMATMESPGLVVGRMQITRLLFLPIHRGQTTTIHTRQVEEPIRGEVGMEEAHMQAELQDLEDRDRAVLDFRWDQDQRDNRLSGCNLISGKTSDVHCSISKFPRN